jgi:Tol biopolymer transport system component
VDASLWIFDAPTGASRKIASCHEICRRTAWSPDGTTIALTQGDADAPETTDTLMLIGVDGRTKATFTPKAGWWVIDPAWAPDGSTIVFP